MKTKLMNKALAWLMTVTMLLSMMPGMAFAAEESTGIISATADTFNEALDAASRQTGDVTVEIEGKVTLNSSLSGSYDSIKFVGKEDTDAEIYLDVQGYITATGKKVVFEDLKLSKAEGGYITNAGFMNVAFGVYDVAEVTYTNCTFANGAYASSGKVTFTGCTFMRSYDKYGLWAYGNVDVTVDDCTFADYRGIKMYAEGAAKTVDLTVKNTDFSAVTDKPAIVLTYGESVTLEGNTYSNTGVFELDLDGAPNGTAVTSDVPPICKNDNGACGVLVDGKIYTTVAQAAGAATTGSTITLLHDSAETVELPEGVTLNKNGYTAAGVTVVAPAAPQPTSTLTNCYTSGSTYWGECGGNASESFVFKFYNGDTYMGYTSLNNVGGIIDGDVYVSFNIKLDAASNTDEYWTMAWEIQPTLDMQPTRVEHWVDGVKAAEAAVEPNWSDRILPVVAAVTAENGTILSYVNGTEGHTLADAIANGGYITLLDDVTLTDGLHVPAGKVVVLDLNGKTISQSKACTASYSMIENKGSLTVQDTVGGGKISFTDTGAGDPEAGWGSYTIHNAGTLTVEGGTIENLSAQNQAGQPFAHTSLAIFQYSGSTTINGGIISTPNYRSVRLWSGDMTITGGTFEGQVWVQCVNNTAKMTITGGAFAPCWNDGSSVFVNNKGKTAELSVTGGTFTTRIGADDATALGGAITGGQFSESAKNGTNAALLAEDFAFSGEPNAEGFYTVAQAAKVELPEVAVTDIKDTLTDEDPDLTFALNFAIKDLANLDSAYLEKVLEQYGDMYTDYVLTISGLTDDEVVFNANGGADGYLAGQYDAWSENWVSVPFEDVTIQNGQSLYIMEYAAKLMGQSGLRFTLAEVAEIVQNFDCGVYFTPEFLAANPGMKVELELKVFTEDEDGNKTGDISVATNDFAAKDFAAAVTAKDKQTQYFATLTDALAAAKAGDTVEMFADAKVTGKVTLTKGITIDGNGHSIIADETAVWYTTGGKPLYLKQYKTHLLGVNADGITLKDIVLDNNDNAAGINVYCAQNVVFDNVSIINATKGMAGLTVNGSTLTAKNELRISGNAIAIDVSNGSGVTSALDLTIEEGTVTDLDNKTVKFASVAAMDVTGAVTAEGKPYFASKDNAYYYTQAQMNSRTTGYSNGLTLLADVEMTKELKVNGTLDLNGNVLTGSVTTGSSLTVTGEGAVTDGFVLNDATHTLTGPEGLTVTTSLDGYKVVYENGVYKVVEDTPAVTYVAAVNGTQHPSLAEAVAAATGGDTVTLIANVTEDVTVNKDLTIDGANFNYTGNIAVKGSAVDVIIKNVNFVNGTGYAVTTNTIKSVTIEDCTVTNYGYGFLYANKSTPTVAVKDVTVSGGNYGFHWVYGTAATFENVTMTDVTYGFYIQNYASKTITVKNCSVSSVGIWERDGKSGVQTFAFEGSNTVTEPSASQYAKYVLAAADATLTAPEGLNVTTAVEDSLVKYVAGAYKVVKAAAKIGDVKYETLAEAIEAAAEGDEIDIVKDLELDCAKYVTNSDGYAALFNIAGKAVTIDLNGKSISASPTAEQFAQAKSSLLFAVFAVDTNGMLTLKDSVGTGNVTVTANDAKVYSLAACYGEGGKLVIESGSYMLDKANSSLVYAQHSIAGVEPDGITGGVVISGGNFHLGNVGTGTNGSPWLFNVNGKNEGHIWLTGGTFNADVMHQYWEFEVQSPENAAIKDNGDGTWTVIEAVAAVGEKSDSSEGYTKVVGYATLAEAIEAADAGETVTLLTDIHLTESVTIAAGDEIVLDLNGKTITGTDTTSKNFGLINNNGTLTIKDSSEQTGAIKLTATVNSGWNRYSAAISNNPGGTLVVESGVIEHLGGTDMAYGIDSLTNGGIGDVSVTINGGTVKSAYRAIRQFLNSDSKENVLTINGGTIEGDNKAVFFHDPSTKANNGTITIGENAVVKGGVYLFVTEGSTEWPVEVSIAAAALGEDDVTSKNVPEGYEVKETNGIIGVVEVTYVAEVDGVKFADLQAAIDAAHGKTVTVLTDIALTESITVSSGMEVTIDLNGKTVSYTTTENKAEDLLVNNGDLTITDSSADADGKLSYQYTGAPDSGYTYDNATIENKGTLTILAGTVENTTAVISHAFYAINTGAGATLNVKGGKVLNLNGHAIRQVSFGTTANNVSISDGYVEGTRAIQVQLPGSSSATTAPEMKLTISGGELKSNESTYNLAVYVYSNGQSGENVTVAVSGDAVINGNIALNGDASQTMKANAASVTGGTLNGEYGIFSYAEDAVAAPVIAITGGIFATNYSEVYAEDDGYEFVQNENGTYGVVEKEAVELFNVYDVNMVLSDSLTVNYYVKQADIDPEKNYYIRITKTYADGRGDVVRIYPEGEWKTATINKGVETFCVSFDGVAAKEMADDMLVQVFFEDDTPASKEMTMSIRKYAMAMLSLPTYSTGKWATLFVDMLNYGAAAQQQFNYNVDDLANNQLTAAQQALATQSVTAEKKLDSSEDRMFQDLNLELKNEIILKMWFVNVTDDMYAVVRYTDHYGNEETMTIPYSEMETLTQKDTKYYGVCVRGLAIADGRQPVTCALYNSNGQISYGTASVESYVAIMNEAAGGTPNPLYTNIMKFIDSAYNCFHP